MSKLAAALNVRRKKKMAAGGMIKDSESLPENQGATAPSPRERLSQIDQGVEQSDPAHQEEESRHIPDAYADGGKVKPKLQPLKEPSMIRPTGPFKVKSMAQAREDEMKRMADGGEVDEEADAKAKAKEKQDQDDAAFASKAGAVYSNIISQRPMLADGGMIEDEKELEKASSVASAIMAKRRMMAEGGEVDLESNAKEDMHVAQDLNLEAGLKENYSESDMLDMDQPEDSNEHGDSIEADRHDMIAAIRRKMSKSPMSR